jgi:hypothetical protein
MSRTSFPTDVTDEQWEVLHDLVPAPKPGSGRAPIDRRETVNGLFRRWGCGFCLRRSPTAASGQRQRDGASHRPSLGTTESICSTTSTMAGRTEFRMAWTLEAPVERLRTEASIKPRNAATGVDPTHASASGMISCESTPTPS